LNPTLNEELPKLLCHLCHFAAFLSTCAASLGTSGHLLVVSDFLAGGGTVLTALGTTFSGMSGHRTLSGAKRRTHSAAVRAIHAAKHGCGMFLFPVADERSAVMEARIALNGTR
jgi:hypothetical protein